jgi:hypothetical protein
MALRGLWKAQYLGSSQKSQATAAIVLGGYSFTDQIVRPGYRFQQCHAVPKMWDYRDRDVRAARTFDWSLEDVRFKFGD